MLKPLAYGFNNERRRLEVHVGNPHRNYILGTEYLFHIVKLKAIRMFARNNFVKIVFHFPV